MSLSIQNGVPERRPARSQQYRLVPGHDSAGHAPQLRPTPSVRSLAIALALKWNYRLFRSMVG